MVRQHWDLLVTGRVQGVGFRHWVVRTAHELGLDCQVRNREDGSVFIEAEGEEPRLQALFDRCRTGPPLARVASVERDQGPVRGYRGTHIVR